MARDFIHGPFFWATAVKMVNQDDIDTAKHNLSSIKYEKLRSVFEEVHTDRFGDTSRFSLTFNFNLDIA